MNTDGSVDYCHDCLGSMTIQCVWCGEPILVGDPITLYTPAIALFAPVDEWCIPKHAVIYRKEHPVQLVGCLRMSCADSSADRAGFWLPGEDGKGRVLRVQTALEAILNAPVSSIMLVRDTHDFA
ncbi:MAG: hypothetical protein WCW66_00520 [Patescibacteria group bacterium]